VAQLFSLGITDTPHKQRKTKNENKTHKSEVHQRLARSFEHRIPSHVAISAIRKAISP
jgi:hypothetical protein